MEIREIIRTVSLSCEDGYVDNLRSGIWRGEYLLNCKGVVGFRKDCVYR